MTVDVVGGQDGVPHSVRIGHETLVGPARDPATRAVGPPVGELVRPARGVTELGHSVATTLILELGVADGHVDTGGSQGFDAMLPRPLVLDLDADIKHAGAVTGMNGDPVVLVVHREVDDVVIARLIETDPEDPGP